MNKECETEIHEASNDTPDSVDGANDGEDRPIETSTSEIDPAIELASMRVALRARITEMGIGDAAVVDRLIAFGEFVLRGNARCNLTSARTLEAVGEHILDSLTFLGDIRGPLVDIGSGGGFPAIPIAIATGVRTVMIEATGKKAGFLESVVREFSLDATVLRGRAETFALEEAYRAQFACATARAVAVAPAVIEYSLPYLAIGGRALLQRGSLPDDERAAAADAALVLGGELREERIIDGQKRLLVIEKSRPTAWRFPRKNGAPVKQPLCLAVKRG